MKKTFFIAVFGLFMFAGCKFMSKSVNHKPQSVVKKAGVKKAVEMKVKTVSKSAPVRQIKPVQRTQRGFTLALKALSEVCAFVPDHVDALFFASGKEARHIINSLASGIPTTTGFRRTTRFFRMMETRFGLKDSKKVSDILVVEAAGRVFVFAKGIGVELKNRESYSSGVYKFVLAKLPGVHILSGLFNGWVVIGQRDAVLKLAARVPGDTKDNCNRLQKKISTVLGPNMYRDPFNMAVGCVLPLSAAIFWDSARGMRVLAPAKGNVRGIRTITTFVKRLKQAFSRLQAESDAGAPALYPVGRMKDADLAIITLKEQRRAGMFVLDARGNLVDLVLAVYQQKLRPFLERHPQ